MWLSIFSLLQDITFPLTEVPIGRGLTVTIPFKASSRTLAEIVVLIGTPNLLFQINAVNELTFEPQYDKIQS